MAVAAVGEHGWRVARVTKRGYLIMRCPCGEHQETLHKTPSLPDHFRGKADRMVAICSTGILRTMFLVETDVRLGSSAIPLTNDEISDLIEKVVDELDELPVSPSMGTRRVGEDTEMTIGVVVDDEDQFQALRHGAAVISAGLHSSTGSGPDRRVVPRDEVLRSSVRVLQSA